MRNKPFDDPLAVAALSMVLHCPSCGMQHIDAPDDALVVSNPSAMGKSEVLVATLIAALRQCYCDANNDLMIESAAYGKVFRPYRVDELRKRVDAISKAINLIEDIR